jgi:hypothetical protein
MNGMKWFFFPFLVWYSKVTKEGTFRLVSFCSWTLPTWGPMFIYAVANLRQECKDNAKKKQDTIPSYNLLFFSSSWHTFNITEVLENESHIACYTLVTQCVFFELAASDYLRVKHVELPAPPQSYWFYFEVSFICSVFEKYCFTVQHKK